VTKPVDEGNEVDLIYRASIKTFDIVSNGILLTKLIQIGMDMNTVTQNENLLKDCKQCTDKWQYIQLNLQHVNEIQI